MPFYQRRYHEGVIRNFDIYAIVAIYKFWLLSIILVGNQVVGLHAHGIYVYVGYLPTPA